MPASDLYNPYAPPQTNVPGAWQSPYTAKQHPPDLAEALRRLNEHVANPESLARDRRARGARIRPVGWVFTGVGIAGMIVGAVLASGTAGQEAVMFVAIGVGAVSVLLGLVLLALDLSLASRDKPAPPVKTLKSFLKAITMARYGYAWTALSPTAREQTVPAPQLGPVQTEPGAFPLAGEADMKAYASSFARTSGAVMRVMAVKRVTQGPIDGDVTNVEVELHFQSWPRWVSIVTVVGFVIFRPLLIIGAVLYFSLRKRYKTRVTKTMLRAQNGVWYIYDGDVLEGAVAV